MSLDVSLIVKEPVGAKGTGVFVRENGTTRELTREEVAAHWPDAVVAEQEYETDCVYSGNITHNLASMASEAGVYLALWRPGEMLAPDIHAAIVAQQELGNYHNAGGAYELEIALPTAHGRDLIAPLEAGLRKLQADPAHYKQFNSPNGWGMYEHFVPFVAEYLGACRAYPDATVGVSR